MSSSADLAVAGDEIPEAHQHLGDGSDIGRRTLAIALEQAPDAGLAHQVVGEVEVERRQRVRRVAHHLDRGAAGAERQERPEGGIDRHPRDQLDRLRPADHRLHGEALDTCPGLEPRHTLEDSMRGLLSLLGPLKSQTHAAHFGLVREVVGQDLDDTGAVVRDPACGESAHLRRVTCHVGRDDRDAVGGEQDLGFDLRQHRAARCQHLSDGPARRLGVEAEVLGQRGRRAHQLVLGAGVAHELREAVDRLAWGGEAGDAVGCEQGAGVPACSVAEPVRQHGLADFTRLLALLEGGENRLGNSGAGGECRRAVHDQDGIRPSIIEDRLKGILIAGGVRHHRRCRLGCRVTRSAAARYRAPP